MKIALRKDNYVDPLKEIPSDITYQKWKEINDNIITNIHLAMTSIAKRNIVKEI